MSKMNEFQYTVANLLMESRLEKLNEICFNAENRNKVYDGSMELFKSVFTHFLEKKTTLKERQIIRELFVFIGETADAKEMLVAIWENLDPMYDLDAFELLIPCLTIICRKAIKTDLSHLNYNIGVSLSTLTYYGDGLNPPDYTVVDDPETNPDLSYEESRIYKFLTGATEVGVLVLQDLMEFKTKEGSSVLPQVEVDYVTFCAELLFHLCCIDLDDKLKNPEHNCVRRSGGGSYRQPHVEAEDIKQINTVGSGEAGKIVDMIVKIHPSWALIKNTSWKSITSFGSEDEEQNKRTLGRGCLFYLVMVCNVKIDYFPQILSPSYVFFSTFASFYNMITATHNPAVIYKGLKLFFSAVIPLEPLSLTTAEFKKVIYKKFRGTTNISAKLLTELCRVAIHCPFTSIRADAIKLVGIFLDKFQWLDRFDLTRILLTRNEDAGVLSFIVSYFKDKIDEILREPRSPGYHHFIRNTQMAEVLDMIFELDEGSETDIMSCYDRLMSALNLLRFLFIRDKNNETLIWNRAPAIEKLFIAPLITAINISRMHMKEEVRKANSKKPEEQLTSMKIGGVPLMSMDKERRIQIVNSAIFRFDMMQSVCSRTQQLIDDKSKS